MVIQYTGVFHAALTPAYAYGHGYYAVAPVGPRGYAGVSAKSRYIGGEKVLRNSGTM
jgi:hypothetical protein